MVGVVEDAMWGWIKGLFGKRVSGASVEEPDAADEHQRIWDERVEGLHNLLGPSEDMHLHAVVPLFLGGSADVLEFRNHIDGHCYVTSDLTGDDSQLKNSLGNYELMICTREKVDWAPNLISKLALYTFEAVLEPGETMDIGPALPDGSRASALLFVKPELSNNQFYVDGSQCGLLLCLTIMPDELELKMKSGSEPLVRALKEKGVFPFSDLNRESVS
jgi:hypothetical protein